MAFGGCKKSKKRHKRGKQASWRAGIQACWKSGSAVEVTGHQAQGASEAQGFLLPLATEPHAQGGEQGGGEKGPYLTWDMRIRCPYTCLKCKAYRVTLPLKTLQGLPA